MTTKYKSINTDATETPSFAYSLLLILSLCSYIIFGMFPGISIPPLIKSPISKTPKII